MVVSTYTLLVIKNKDLIERKVALIATVHVSDPPAISQERHFNYKAKTDVKSSTGRRA